VQLGVDAESELYYKTVRFGVVMGSGRAAAARSCLGPWITQCSSTRLVKVGMHHPSTLSSRQAKEGVVIQVWITTTGMGG
jgi:hypothetical protein